MLYVNLLISIAIGSGVGVYMLTMVFIKDIKNNLDVINEMAKSKRRRTQLFKQLTDTIHTHSIGKELSIQCFTMTSHRKMLLIRVHNQFYSSKIAALMSIDFAFFL